MSVRVMTAVWDITLPDSEKIVLLALADAANDEGHCWPSIATIARKASKSVRTVQIVIQRLIAGGHLTRKEHAGRGCEYWVHPRSGCTPAVTAPPQGVRGTPARTAGDPRSGCAQTVKNRKEPKGGRARGRASPPGVSDQDQAGKAAGSALPDDWAPPPVGELTGTAATLVKQWPPGAYEAACETFRLHWLSESGSKGRKRDWGAALAKWLIGDHAKIMRDAKAGVSFAHLVTPPADRAAKAAVEPICDVAAKRREDARSAALHVALRRDIGVVLHGQWIEHAALIVTPDGHPDPGLTVITASAFIRAWIEDRFRTKLLAAARGVLGADGVKWVRFEVEDIMERAA